MPGIDFSKFTSSFKTLWNEAIKDNIVTLEEQSKFDAKDRSIFLKMLEESPEAFQNIEIEYVTAQKNNDTSKQTLTMYSGNEANEGRLDLKEETLKLYPNAAFGYLKDGIVTLYDKSGHIIKDEQGNYARFNMKDENSGIANWYMKHTQKFDLETLTAMQNLDQKINQAEDVDEDYSTLMQGIKIQELKNASEDEKQDFFNKMEAKVESKREQARIAFKQATEMLYKAHENGTLSEKGEAFYNALMSNAQVLDGDIGITRFKEVMKEMSGVNWAADFMTDAVDDGDDKNLSFGEKAIELVKGGGRAIDNFIGTQGLAFSLALGGASEISAVAGAGEAFGIMTQAYFMYEGANFTAEGIRDAINATTKEEANEAGEKIGTGTIMLAGTGKSIKKAGEKQSGKNLNKENLKNDGIIIEDIKQDSKNIVNIAEQDGAIPNNAVNVYKLSTKPNAKLKEYSYTSKNGKTYKFMAIEDISQKDFQYLTNLDFTRRRLNNTYSRFDKFSENTQIRFAKLVSVNNTIANSLLCLYRSINDEKQLLDIINNKDLLKQKLTDIKELENYFSYNDFEMLGGLLDIKRTDPAKYERIASSGIFELIKDGKVSSISLMQVGKHADLSADIYSDLQLLKAGKSIVAEFSENTPINTAFEQTKVGDVVEVGQKMYINDGNKLIEWNMTKDKYLELFPPVQRFATTQGAIPDCYLIQTMGLAMHNPKARAEFLQSFSLKGDDIIVTVKGLEDYYGSKTFENSEINLSSNGKHCAGCKGMQMYEQTYASVALREKTPVDYPNIASVDDMMTRIHYGQGAQAMADVFGQGHIVDILPQKLKHSLNDPQIHNSTSYSSLTYERIPYNNKGKTVVVDLNIQKNAKTKILVFDKFFENYPDKALALRNLDINTIETLLSHVANNPDYLISFGTRPKKGAAAESAFLPEYNIVSSHAYSILGYDTNTKMVKIGNPHSFSEVTEIPLDALHQYIQHIDFLKL